ncbi:MAG: hypothetical protein KGL39_15530 [Patescibacteria group bacterium]|nr:hypothetical protein [Patescibacteria group bacterium]
MAIVDEILTALARIPVWKRVATLPDEVAALRARIDAIEQNLAGKTGTLCPVCKAADFKIVSSGPDPTFGDLGLLADRYRCASCGHSESRQR